MQYGLEIEREVQRIMEFKEKNHLIKMMVLGMKRVMLRKMNCFHNKFLCVFKIQPLVLCNLNSVLNLIQGNTVLITQTS